METGIPFNATDFVDALQSIYTKTHPPDEEVSDCRTDEREE